MYVYVINKHGEPLMPCKPRKARVLLQNGKATVVKRNPFTIKLIYGSSGYKQAVTLGMNAGSKHVGIAATTEKNVLYAEEQVGLWIFEPWMVQRSIKDLCHSRKSNT